MEPKANAPTRAAARRLNVRAFTLVELLIVIAVITLLVGIMLPAVQGVKDAAKSGATKAMIHSLSTGLDMFKIEIKLGRQYPPSIWHTGTGGDPNAFGLGSYTAYGAQTLVWGLAGADMLGTPGFQIDPPSVLLDKEPNGLYALDGSMKPVKPRFSLIDISRTKIKKPRELGLSFGPTLWILDPNTPVFTDNFDWPVLYYTPDANDNYVLTDNDAFLNPNRPRNEYDTIANSTDFNEYIQDTRITTTPQPHNRDSYLLISAGPDKRYGTGDDVTNFPFTPQTLP